MGLNKKTFIIIIVAILVLGTITTLLIYSQNYKQTAIEGDEEKGQKENIGKETTENGIKRLELTDTYNENDLEIIKSEKNIDRVNIHSIKISGLKNKEIENKVNDLIEEKINGMLSKLPTSGYDSIEINANVSANFSNVLSIEIHGYTNPWNTEISINTQGVNVDLTTGEELKITDLFNSEEEFYTSIRNQIYLNKISDIEDYEYWVYEDMPEYDETIIAIKERQSSLDEDVLNDFIKVRDTIKEGVNFYFTNRFISMLNKDIEKILYNIDMNRNYTQVGIYTKYLTRDSIFEQNGIGRKNLFVFSNRRRDIYYSYQEKLLDNLYVDFIISAIDWEETQTKVNILEEVKKKYNNIIEEIKKEMEKEKNRAKAIFIYCGYDMLSDDYKLMYVNERYKEYEMSSEYYKNDFIYTIVKNIAGNIYGGMEDIPYIYLYGEMEKHVSLDENEIKYFWDTKNNKKVEDTIDIFNSEEDYEIAMQIFLKEKWQEKYGILLSPEELAEKNKSTTAELSEYEYYNYSEGSEIKDNYIIFKNDYLGKTVSKYGYPEDYHILFKDLGDRISKIKK